jgi:hypothetical protein
MNYPKPINISKAIPLQVVFKFTPRFKKPIKASNKTGLTPEMKIALIACSAVLLFALFAKTPKPPKKLLKKRVK